MENSLKLLSTKDLLEPTITNSNFSYFACILLEKWNTESFVGVDEKVHVRKYFRRSQKGFSRSSLSWEIFEIVRRRGCLKFSQINSVFAILKKVQKLE